MGRVDVIEVAPAFRFEVVLALRLLTSDQSDFAQIVRANQREFVDRWYEPTAPLRSAIDAAIAPGGYWFWLCHSLLLAGNTVAGVQGELRRQRAEADERTMAAFTPTEGEAWLQAAAAVEAVLPEFHEQCFRHEWARWEPLLNQSAARMRDVITRVPIFPFVESFTGRDYGSLEMSVHPSEYVRPSDFAIGRDGRDALVLQRERSDTSLIMSVVHESAHGLFRHPDWFETGSFTPEDMAWLESLLPSGWQAIGYETIRYYVEETFLTALAYNITGRLLPPERRDEVHEQALRNFRERELVLGKSIYEATEAEYDPAKYDQYDDFLTALVQERRVEAEPVA
jgi:hypothetical protein